MTPSNNSVHLQTQFIHLQTLRIYCNLKNVEKHLHLTFVDKIHIKNIIG